MPCRKRKQPRPGIGFRVLHPPPIKRCQLDGLLCPKPLTLHKPCRGGGVFSGHSPIPGLGGPVNIMLFFRDCIEIKGKENEADFLKPTTIPI